MLVNRLWLAVFSPVPTANLICGHNVVAHKAANQVAGHASRQNNREIRETRTAIGEQEEHFASDSVNRHRLSLE